MVVPTPLGTDWSGHKSYHPPPAEHSLETRVFFLAGYGTVQNSSVAIVTTTAWQTRFLAEWWHSGLPTASQYCQAKRKSRLNCPLDLCVVQKRSPKRGGRKHQNQVGWTAVCS